MAIVTMVVSLINENTSPTRERVVHLRNVPKFHLQKTKSWPIHADEPFACASGLYWLHHR